MTVDVQITGSLSGWAAGATPAVSGGGSGLRLGSPAGPSGGAGQSSTLGASTPTTTRTASPSGAGGRWGHSRCGRTRSARKTIIMFANISGELTHVRTWQSHCSLQDTGVHGRGTNRELELYEISPPGHIILTVGTQLLTSELYFKHMAAGWITITWSG